MIILVISGLIWFSMDSSYAHEFLFSWGSEGSEDGEFNQPFGIAIDSDENIYVADNFNNRIQKFNSTGSHLDTWGSKGTGDGEFLKVYGMAFDSMDNLYVIDGGTNDRIQKFTTEGDFVRLWNLMIPGDGAFLNPLDIAIDSKDRIYVLENANNRIQVFDTNGNPITVLGVDGSDDVELQDAIGIAIDPSDGIYILEFGNSQVQKFDEFGSFITKWDIYEQPSGISIDSTGNVYVLDSNRLVKLENDGSPIYNWVSDEVGNYLFDMPNHLEVDSSDRIFVVDGGNNRISVFSQNEIRDPGFHFDMEHLGNSPLIPQGIDPPIIVKDLDGDGIDDDTGLPILEPVPPILGLEIELKPDRDTKVVPGKITGTTIILSQKGTNPGNITLTCTHGYNVLCELNPVNVTLGQTATSELTLITNAETSLGQKPFIIKAKGGGAEDTDSFRIDVNEPPKNPPTSRISPVPPAKVDQPVLFNGTDSSDENGEIKKYHWVFGDLTTGQGSQVTHTYEVPGPYTALLTVTDNDGETHQSERAIIVSPSFDPLWVILLGVIVMMGALAALVITTRKRDGRKPKKINIPKPKESRLK